jgi:hypothetical protein
LEDQFAMDDDASVPQEERSEVSPPPMADAPRRRRRRWPWVLAAVLVSPLVVLAIWTFSALGFAYSSGTRAGYVQKFSRKGWICKTWEGELTMLPIAGTLAQQQWMFTVRSDSIAEVITKSEGSQVSLTYEEHPGLPTSCFGDTRYFVTGVRALGQ